MTDGTAGWFRDPTDPALARWHDGDRWTEHTLVIADQTPGTEPAPPEPSPTVATTVFDDDAPGYGGYADGPTRDEGLSDRVRGLPTWAKVLAPLVVIAVIGVAFLLTSGGDDSNNKTETAGTETATLNEAVDAAREAGLTEEVSDARAAALIERICDATNSPSSVDQLAQDLGNLPAATPGDLRLEIRALGKGADARCHSDLADAPDLINDLQDGAAIAFATTTTAVTLVPDGTGDTVPGGTDSGATTGGGTGGTSGKTATTKKGSAPTTTKAPTTTTTKPLPVVSIGDACSPEGAKGQSASGNSRTCTKKTCAGTALVWAITPKTCQSPATSPTTSPGQTVPTLPPSTTPTTEAP
jgi:hypothetical protein